MTKVIHHGFNKHESKWLSISNINTDKKTSSTLLVLYCKCYWMEDRKSRKMRSIHFKPGMLIICRLTWLGIAEQTFLSIASDLIMHYYKNKDILFYSGGCKAKLATFLSRRTYHGTAWMNVLLTCRICNVLRLQASNIEVKNATWTSTLPLPRNSWGTEKACVKKRCTNPSLFSYSFSWIMFLLFIFIYFSERC